MNGNIEMTADEAVGLKGIVAVATSKIAEELKVFKGGYKETAVSKFVASTIAHFCEQSEKFASVVAKTPRTLSDCCAEILADTGYSVSDIDVYRKAVKHYFPDSEVKMTMEIVTGEIPSDEEVYRAAKKKSAKQRIAHNETTDEYSGETQNTVHQTKAAVAKPETIQLSLF